MTRDVSTATNCKTVTANKSAVCMMYGIFHISATFHQVFTRGLFWVIQTKESVTMVTDPGAITLSSSLSALADPKAALCCPLGSDLI